MHLLFLLPYLASQRTWKLPHGWESLGFWTWLYPGTSVKESALELNSPPAKAFGLSEQNWVETSRCSARAIRRLCPWKPSKRKARGCRLEQLKPRNQITSRNWAWGCWDRLDSQDGMFMMLSLQSRGGITVYASAKKKALQQSHHWGSSQATPLFPKNKQTRERTDTLLGGEGKPPNYSQGALSLALVKLNEVFYLTGSQPPIVRS